jgi:hypothetical protein
MALVSANLVRLVVADVLRFVLANLVGLLVANLLVLRVANVLLRVAAYGARFVVALLRPVVLADVFVLGMALRRLTGRANLFVPANLLRGRKVVALVLVVALGLGAARADLVRNVGTDRVVDLLADLVMRGLTDVVGFPAAYLVRLLVADILVFGVAALVIFVAANLLGLVVANLVRDPVTDLVVADENFFGAGAGDFDGFKDRVLFLILQRRLQRRLVAVEEEVLEVVGERSGSREDWRENGGERGKQGDEAIHGSLQGTVTKLFQRSTFARASDVPGDRIHDWRTNS